LIVVLVVLVVAAAAAAWLLLDRGYTVEVSEDEIQRQIESGFPVRKSVLVAKLVFSNPRVVLHGGSEDRVELRVEVVATGALGSHRKEGSATITGGVRYDPAEGAFYLDDSRIALEIEGAEPERLAKIEEIATELARDRLATIPFHRLDPAGFRDSLARLALKKVKVKRGKVVLTLALRE
jgi:hypothetical protein